MLAHILSHYVAFLWGFLRPFGAWGVLAIAALDGAVVGMPVDAVVAGYAYQGPSHCLEYAFMASLGSTLGSALLYVIGYKGGEELLRKRISPYRFKKIQSAFAEHPFWSLMLPAMLPPPTPFKLFTLAAAVSGMGIVRFLLAIFSGRMIRFLLLAMLTVRFGPEVVHLSAELLTEHLHLLLLAATVATLVGFVRWKRIRSRRALLEE